MEKVVYKSTVSERTLDVFSSSGNGDTTFNVDDRCIDISPADAYDLGKRLIENAKQHGVADEPQPRRPDEVGVWECWPLEAKSHKWEAVVYVRNGVKRYKRSDGECDQHLSDLSPAIVGVRIGDLPSEAPAWPLNGEWGEVGQQPTCEGVFEVDRHGVVTQRKIVREGDGLAINYGDGMEDTTLRGQFVTYRWRYIRPLDEQGEPQEPKPQLIDVAETLMLAVRHLRHEVEWLIERTGADTDRVEHVERIVDQAHDAIAKLREVQ